MVDFEEALQALYEYQSVADFSKIQRRRKRIDSAALFSDGKYKPLLEAWILVKVATALEMKVGSIRVRLVPEREQFPDAKILADGKEYDFEITEALRPGRRRGDEYRGKKYQDRLERPKLVGNLFEEGEKHGAEWIAECIKKKAEKQYAVKPNLVIYVNIDCYKLEPYSIVAESSPFAEAFESIWLIHNNEYLQLVDSNNFGKTDLCWHPLGLE